MQVSPMSAKARREGLEDGSIARLNKRVEETFKLLKTATTGEVSRYLGLSQEVVHKRISDCKNNGLIKPSGLTQRDPDTRRSQTVWELVEKV